MGKKINDFAVRNFSNVELAEASSSLCVIGGDQDFRATFITLLSVHDEGDEKLTFNQLFSLFSIVIFDAINTVNM